MFTVASHALEYMLAGSAIVTAKSLKTGDHYTFKINKSKNSTQYAKQVWFVMLLTAPDTYTYMGLYDDDGFRLTRKSTYQDESTAVRAFRYITGHLRAGNMPPHLTLQHEGSCGRCGRQLTHPESIERGIGPECFKVMSNGPTLF